MRFDDFLDVGGGYAAVPDGVGIHDKIRTVLALVEAAGLIRANFVLQAALGQLLLEDPLQFGLTLGIAAAAGTLGWTLVTADKDVLFEFRHLVNLQEMPRRHLTTEDTEKHKGKTYAALPSRSCSRRSCQR